MSIKSFVSDYAIAAFGAVVLLVLASVCLLFACAIKSNRIKYANMINAIPVESESTALGTPSGIPGVDAIFSFNEGRNKFQCRGNKKDFLYRSLIGKLNWAEKGRIEIIYKRCRNQLHL